MGKELFDVWLGVKIKSLFIRHIEFKMPIRHLNGDFEQGVGAHRKSISLTSAQRSDLQLWDRMRSPRESVDRRIGVLPGLCPQHSHLEL